MLLVPSFRLTIPIIIVDRLDLDGVESLCQDLLDVATNEGSEAETLARPYRKRKRAQQEAATRNRILEAAMRSYESVGPRATTVTAIAEQAGVSRMTVYNHFPSDSELLGASFEKWIAHHPRPQEDTWLELQDPDARLGVALARLYAWYSTAEPMLGHLLGDAPHVPALDELMQEQWWPRIDRVIDILSSGRDPERGPADRRLRAAIRVALDFSTWKSLTSAGLTDAEAAEVGSGFVIMTDALAAGR